MFVCGFFPCKYWDRSLLGFEGIQLPGCLISLSLYVFVFVFPIQVGGNCVDLIDRNFRVDFEVIRLPGCLT
jgi:hypothetical protein